MRKLLIVIIGLISINIAIGQDKMIVDKPFNGNTHYSRFSEHIDSLSILPPVIQFNLRGYLNRILGTMSDSVSFSHGQIVDLENKFKEDSVTYGYGWIVPKYDLNFILCDNSIGIRRYYLQIRLDKYGQILYANWPKEYHSDKNRFKNRSDIERFALKQAKIKGFELNDYKVDFKYNEKLDKLCWVFKFPVKIERNRQEYDALEIPWNYIEVIDEYKTVTSTVY
ncbi:MAG: hypothetical protein R2828_32800 [Saprospiraceae bacterium]